MKKLILLLLTINFAQATIKLPALVSDKMVLQRDKAIKIWGYASPKEAVSVQFLGKTYEAITEKMVSDF